ncbi:metal-dependent hydrolase [Nibricoccus sp. IMCC34717]|uniref:metal-dependent hydrolase n=1 Tax=Nibricoccus sp. IMCC34717 TaxID=3034021 RepID=UPI003850629F
MKKPTKIRFFGVAAYELVTPEGKHVLIDPFFDSNPGSPLKSHDFPKVDLILVSHAASDHFGDTIRIARRTGAPVVCGADIRALLLAEGLPPSQIRCTMWGLQVEVAGIRICPVECRHWSHTLKPDGTLVTGFPLSFVIHASPDCRFYHYGDTAIFSDLKLIGELHKPNVGCIGITDPIELSVGDSSAGRLLTGEMNPQEGALAAQWLGLDTVLPCHYINPDCEDVRAFTRELDSAARAGTKVPQSVVLRPGEWIEI